MMILKADIGQYLLFEWLMYEEYIVKTIHGIQFSPMGASIATQDIMPWQTETKTDIESLSTNLRWLLLQLNGKPCIGAQRGVAWSADSSSPIYIPAALLQSYRRYYITILFPDLFYVRHVHFFIILIIVSSAPYFFRFGNSIPLRFFGYPVSKGFCMWYFI